MCLYLLLSRSEPSYLAAEVIHFILGGVVVLVFSLHSCTLGAWIRSWCLDCMLSRALYLLLSHNECSHSYIAAEAVLFAC